MDTGAHTVAQVFLWKHGTAPDVGYARQVLSVVNPEAYQAIAEDNPPLHLIAVSDAWPEDFWPVALRDMQAVPNPAGLRWTDTSRYEMSGWQGTDTRSGDKLFVVTVFARAGMPDAATFRGEGTQAPQYATQPVPQSPYYPQYATGPLMWPPQGGVPLYNYPPYPGAPPGFYGQQVAYPQGYSPLVTGPIGSVTGSYAIVPTVVSPSDGVAVSLPDSYAPFYSSFGERLAAALIDFFFLSLIEGLTIGIIAAFVLSRSNSTVADFGGWLALYGPFICLGLLVFIAYHVIGWSAYGRTIGKRLMGMRIVRSDGSVPGFGWAMLRMFGYFFSASIAFLGFLLVAFDLRRQGLHDKIAETYVVPDRLSVAVPNGLPGYRSATTQVPQGRDTATPATPQPAEPAQAYTRTNLFSTSNPPEPARGTAAPDTAQEPQGRAEGRSSTERHSEPAGREATASLNAYVMPNVAINTMGPATGAIQEQAERERPMRHADIEKGRALFKSGLATLERGVRQSYSGMEVEPSAAREAAAMFGDALDAVPSAVIYRYFYAVALRYSEGFDVAIGEFRQVLEQDPGHYEAQEQVAYGPRWHDAFGYPAWGEPSPVDISMPLPEPVRLLLPQPNRPGTRLVLLREGSNKMVVVLSRTRRDSWSKLPNENMPARVEIVLTRTPAGPIMAFYVIISDDPENPYKGETFLNPHDPGQPSDDACQLGQHILAQLARQDHTYLIFVDEKDNLLMSRKLVFDAATQVNIARVNYEVQTLPPMMMDATRFGEAAQWHMDNFSLDQIKP